MSKIAIVIGANGWLGKTLSNFLINGHPDHEKLNQTGYDEIRCLVFGNEDTSTLESFSPQIHIFKGDITKKETLVEIFSGDKEFDLFHAAGIIHPKNVKQFYDINLQGTINVLNVIPENKCNKIVVVSSNSPIGCNPFPEHLFDETSPYNPYMNYGRSKMLMEESASEIAVNKKLSITFIRCPWFYGPNQPARQTLFFQMIKDGKMPIVGDGNNRRSMSFIDNLCQGIMLASLVRSEVPSTYWIADERPYSMNEIIDTVEDVLKTDFNYDVKGTRMKLPWVVGEIATVIDWVIQSLGLYHQKFHVLSEMNKSISCSVEKAKMELDYKPTVELREGMRRSIEWCKKNEMEI